MPTPEEYRMMELAAAPRVARERAGGGALFKAAVFIGALGLAGSILYSGLGTPPAPSFTTPDGEEFSPARFPAPDLAQSPPARDQGVVVVAPEPPLPVQPPAVIEVPPPPQIVPPPPLPEPVAMTDPGIDEAEARRREEEERRRWERFRAASIVVDHSSADMALGPGGPGQGEGGPSARDEDGNRRFLDQVSAAPVETAQATRNHRIDALVPQGTMIRAVLENAVNSDLPGMVRAVTTENVWSFDGRRILIPSGTRLVGDYRSGIARGQTRIFIVWTRMLRADGVSVQLGSPGGDELGRTGVTGFVDNKYLERFGSAIVLSLVGGVSQFIGGLGVRDTGSAGDVTIADPSTGLVSQSGGSRAQQDRARQIAAQTTSQTLTQLAQDALRDSIDIPPTIHLDQGTRVVVFVRRDLDFSAIYPDPVREALREIRRERARLP